LAVGPGMLLILTAAILWALHLVALERWSRGGRLYGLTLIQLAASAVVGLGCQVLLDDGKRFWLPLSVSAGAGIFFLGAAATGGAFVGLSWAQTRLDATTSAVILTIEPLVGASLGAALGDPWNAPTLAGAIAVLTAVCLVARPVSDSAWRTASETAVFGALALALALIAIWMWADSRHRRHKIRTAGRGRSTRLR